MPLATRKIVGRAVYGDNTGAACRLHFSPQSVVGFNGTVVLPGPVTVTAGSGGHFEVELAATDAQGYVPEGWVWQVEERFPGGRTFFFELPSGSEPISYTELIPASSIADPFAAHEHTQYLTAEDIGEVISGVASVNGQSGIVVLGASDVGAYPDTNPDGFVDASAAAAAAPVQSVNGETGAVTLSAADVGALADDAELDDLADVDVLGASENDLLAYDGSEWVATDSPAVSKVSFDTATPGALDAAGDLAWDDLDQALSYRTDGITVDIAQENLVYVRNSAGNTSIPKGAAVAVKGAAANRLEVQLCDATAGGQGCRTLGVAITAIPSPGFGFVSTFGMLRGFNTGAVVTSLDAPMVAGAELYITGTPGVLATFPQPSPGRRVLVGYVVTTGAEGSIFVTVRRGLTVNELDNVNAPAPTDGQTLAWDNTNSLWAPVTPTPAPVESVNGETGAVVLTASDVGAYPDTNPDNFVDAAGAAAAAPVQSVNGETGTVELAAADVGAYPDNNPDSFVDAAGAAAAAPVQSVNGETGTVSLTASDVGAYPDDNPDAFVDAAGAAAAAPVQSVNGETGTVTLDATDVGAYPNDNPSGFIDAAGAPVQSVNTQTGDVVLAAADVGAYPDDNPSSYIDAAGAPVQSVNTQTGDVVLAASDVGAYPDDNPDGFVDSAGAASAAPVQSVNTQTGTVELAAADVGAYPDDNPDGFVDATGAAAAAPVQSVNTQTGTVVLGASDVGAYPDTNPSGFIDAAGAPVQSVNGDTGTVSLGVSDLDDFTQIGSSSITGQALVWSGTDWQNRKVRAEDLAQSGAPDLGDIIAGVPGVPINLFGKASIASVTNDHVELGDLADVSVSGAVSHDIIAYNGDDWVLDNLPPLAKADMVGDQELGMFSSRVSGFTGSRPDDDNIHFSYFTSYISGQPGTVYISISGGNASGMSAAKVGIYSVATNGDLTLVWTSASIISELEASGNFRVVTIDTTTGTWTGSLVRGGRYAFAFYQLATTRASLARLNADGALNAVPPIMASRFGVPPSSPNLPSTLQSIDLASDFRYYWAALKL